MQDHEIVIALGKNRSDTNWKNQYITWGEFVEKLNEVRRTSESVDAYDKMTPAQKGKIKDGPAFVGGFVQAGRRKKENVQSRSIITLDVDFGNEDFFFDVDMALGGYAYVIYSTHSHREASPKYRLIILADREMNPDEYAATSRKIASLIGMNYFDKTTFDVHRLMYLPSCSSDAEPFFQNEAGEPLEVDNILAKYEDWTDPTEWDRHPTEEVQRKTAKKMEDPKEKNGIIGAFCRTYPISLAIETFLSDVYEPTVVEDRYTFIGASSHGGLVIYDEDAFAFSHHESDPISGREVNSFDLVRIHKFRDLDEKAKEKTNITKLPSFQAMNDFAMNDKATKVELMDTEFADMDFDEEVSKEEYNWKTDLELNPKTLEVLSNSRNLELILSNGAFRNVLAYDAFKNAEVIRGHLPWRQRERLKEDYEPWLGADDKRLSHWVNKKYDIRSESMIKNALAEVVHSNAFHPVKEYLESFVWDGEKRIDKLFIDYLGADDTPYTREVTRKIFLAAVKRIYEPGCKFDEMLVLVGPQGAGKSSLLAKMGRKWFSDSLKSFKDNKEASEHLQGAWIIEIGELAAMKKAEVEEIKQFLSKVEDRYRVAFDRVVSDFPRKCILVGTTNNKNFLYDPTGNRRFWPLDIHPDKRKANHWDELDDETVGQLWAEVLEAYRSGEGLQLSKEGYEEAKKQQEGHYDADTREGLIEEYLNTPLPSIEEWDAMDIYQRRDYLENPDGDRERTIVCVSEVYEECFNKNAADVKNYESKIVADMIRRIPGWQDRTPTQVRFKLYGRQRAFEKVST